MPQSQMNVRIDDALKRQGDAILQRNGYSPSSAVRALYEEVVSINGVPGFMGDQRAIRHDEIRREIDDGAALAWKAIGMHVPQSLELDIEAARLEHAEEMISKYGF